MNAPESGEPRGARRRCRPRRLVSLCAFLASRTLRQGTAAISTSRSTRLRRRDRARRGAVPRLPARVSAAGAAGLRAAVARRGRRASLRARSRAMAALRRAARAVARRARWLARRWRRTAARSRSRRGAAAARLARPDALRPVAGRSLRPRSPRSSRGRDRLGLGLLGAAIAAKLYPAVLVPLAVVWIWRRRGRREVLVCRRRLRLGVLAARVRPVPAGRAGRGRVKRLAPARPAAADREPRLGCLLAAHHRPARRRDGARATARRTWRARRPRARSSRPSLQRAVLLCRLARVSRAARSTGSGRSLPAAAVVAFVALGKVLSPQFLIWLLPLVGLLAGTRGARALGAARRRVRGHAPWFPSRYWDFALQFDQLTSLARARPRSRAGRDSRARGPPR